MVADTVQILCAWHGKHHIVWLKVPSAVKDWGRAYFRGEKPSGRAHTGDKVFITCGSLSLTAWGLSSLARNVCCLPGTSLMRGWWRDLFMQTRDNLQLFTVTGWDLVLCARETNQKAQHGFVLMQLQFIFQLFRRSGDSLKVVVHLTLFPGRVSQFESCCSCSEVREGWLCS